MSDINETIASITMEYLKPKYPVYKIKVVESYISFDDDEDYQLNTHTRTLILEADDKFYDNWKANPAPTMLGINESDKRCSLRFAKDIINRKCDCRSVIQYNSTKTWFILSCERLA